MKRSFLGVFVAASLITLGACAGDEADDDIEPVEEVQPPPITPAPVPIDTMPPDTLRPDTLTTTTGM